MNIEPNTMSFSEKMPLRVGDTGNQSYESIISVENSLILCSHGNTPENCCKDIISEELMSSQHCHPLRDVGVDKKARRRLILASILCLLFMIGEVVGGLLSNSLAIATDAAHLLTDFASFMISLSALWLAARPATKRMSFGWYRAEVIGAMISVLLIWVVTGILVYMAVQRIVAQKYEIDATIMLITAAVGVAVNIIMGISLQYGGVPHGHSHGSDPPKGHAHDSPKGHAHDANGTGNINVRAAFIHVVGDFIQSLGVLVAACIIYFDPELGIVDPICTFLFSVLVLMTTFKIMKEALNVLMEGIPRGIDFLEVQRVVFAIHGVLKVHNLRIWSLSMDKIALSAHLAIAPEEDAMYILRQASKEIRSKFDIFELTLQVEEYKEDMQACSQCQDPKD